MVVMSIKCEIRHQHALEALNLAKEMWMPEMFDDFCREWRSLENAGAQMAECQFVGGRLVAYPSEDFTLHMQKWGIYL